MKISPMNVELIDHMGSDDSVVNAARVSFAKEASKFTPEQNQKLLQYLAKYNHWSPFAHAFLSFRIKAPIFVARQLVKHQVGLAWNEVSRRYVQEEPEFFFPTSWRSAPDGSIKQGSGAQVDDDAYSDAAFHLQRTTEQALASYNELLTLNIAPEQARMVLPQNTMTEWIWSGSLAAFARVCKLRLDPHAQKETQEVALAINNLIPETFKHSWKALLD